MIDVHYVRTSNGQKIAIMLEEARLDYRIVEYDIFAGDHLRADFKAINPNQRLPVITDRDPADGGVPVTVFETGAILVYLAEKSGVLLPHALRPRMAVLQWLAWQISALGPMLGQAYHFARYAPPGQDYGMARYTREARRLLAVLDGRLDQHGYIAEDYSIADIACWPWLQNVGNLDIDRAEYPAVQRWFDTIAERPAVKSVVNNGKISVPASYLNKRMELTPDQWRNLFGDNMQQMGVAD